jgi:hypothetical protein
MTSHPLRDQVEGIYKSVTHQVKRLFEYGWYLIFLLSVSICVLSKKIIKMIFHYAQRSRHYAAAKSSLTDCFWASVKDLGKSMK